MSSKEQKPEDDEYPDLPPIDPDYRSPKYLAFIADPFQGWGEGSDDRPVQIDPTIPESDVTGWSNHRVVEEVRKEIGKDLVRHIYQLPEVDADAHKHAIRTDY